MAWIRTVSSQKPRQIWSKIRTQRESAGFERAVVQRIFLISACVHVCVCDCVVASVFPCSREKCVRASSLLGDVFVDLSGSEEIAFQAISNRKEPLLCVANTHTHIHSSNVTLLICGKCLTVIIATPTTKKKTKYVEFSHTYMSMWPANQIHDVDDDSRNHQQHTRLSAIIGIIMTHCRKQQQQHDHTHVVGGLNTENWRPELRRRRQLAKPHDPAASRLHCHSACHALGPGLAAGSKIDK